MAVRRGAWLLTCWLAAPLALGGCEAVEKLTKDESSSEDDGGRKKKKKKKDDEEDEDDGGKKIVRVATYEPGDYHWACLNHPGDQTFKLRSYPESDHEDAVEAAQEMLERLAKRAEMEPPLLRGIEAVGARSAVGMLPDNTKGPYKRGKLVLLIHPKLFDVLRKTNEPQAVFLFAHELGHLTAEHSGPPEEREPEVELEADTFAGRILGLEGHPLIASKAWILSNVPPAGAKPERTARLAALAKGWREGCEKSGKCGEKEAEEPEASRPEPEDDEEKKPPKKGGSFSDREGR